MPHGTICTSGPAACARGCKHCLKLWPEWEETAKRLETDPRIAVAAVDCEALKKFCLSAGIDRYPTLRLHRRGMEPTDFTGPRTADSLSRFAMAHLSTHAGGARREGLGVAMGHGRMWPRRAQPGARESHAPAAPAGGKGEGNTGGPRNADEGSGSAKQPAGAGGGAWGRRQGHLQPPTRPVRRSRWGATRPPAVAPATPRAGPAKDEL